MQNGYIERFNKTYRTEVLDCYVFTSLNEVRRMTEDWRHRYNHERPQRSPGGSMPDDQFGQRTTRGDLVDQANAEQVVDVNDICGRGTGAHGDRKLRETAPQVNRC